MHCPICTTCGTQYAACERPPTHCAICLDERQYVGWSGQQWTSLVQLARQYDLRIGDDDGLLGLDLPGFAIPQRALLLPTGAGNLLWECLSLVTPAAIEALRAHGGVDRIVISHPHFYASMVEWSDALGQVPILLHAADCSWVQRDSPAIQWWDGDLLELGPGVDLIRCGGHFDGSTALHWRDGPRAGGALFPGDALQVAMDRRHVAFMYSYPNHIPMRETDIAAIRARLAGRDFADVYGYSRGRNILGEGRAAVDRSFARLAARAINPPE